MLNLPFLGVSRRNIHTVLKIDFTFDFQYERSSFTSSIEGKVLTHYIYSIHDLII